MLLRALLKIMKISKRSLEVGLYTLLGGAVGLMRPTAIGEVYSFHIAVLCLSLIFVLLVLDRFEFAYFKCFPFMIQIFLMFTVGLYLFSHSVIMAYADIFNAFKGFLLTILPVLILIVLVRKQGALKYFFDAFAFVILFSCFSIVVSFFLLAVGVGFESLHVLDFEYTYEGRGFVIFPMTFTFNPVDFGLGPMPRLSGLYREPGVVPAFACWGAAYSYIRRWPLWTTLVFVVGSLLSMSTLGVIALYTGMLILSNRMGLSTGKSIAFFILVALSVWPLVYGFDGVGLQAKIESGSGSFDERYEQFFGFFGAENMLFGDGPSWSGYDTTSINLLAASRTFGSIFLLLILCFLSISVVVPLFFFMAMVPFVFVVFTAQPIVLDSSVIAIWFSWVCFVDGRFRCLGFEKHLKATA